MYRALITSSLVLLLIGSASPARADTIYGGISFTSSREFGGFTQQPEGGLVSVDLDALGPSDSPEGFSRTPGGTTLVADVFDPPPGTDAGYLTGLEAVDGGLYASTFECVAADGCFEGPSRLLRIDPATGASLEIGLIREGATDLFIYDLALNPTNGLLYGVSSFFGSSCFNCLYTIDLATAEATRVGEIPLLQGLAGGLAFAPDGTLYLTTIFPMLGIGPNNNRNPLDFVTLDPATAQVLAREDLLFEQQFRTRAGNTTILVRSAAMQGLAVLPGGRIVASGDNGVTMLYERVFGQVLDPNGNAVGSPRNVWRLLGDAGENVSDLTVLVPEPGLAVLLGAGLLALLARRPKRSA